MLISKGNKILYTKKEEEAVTTLEFNFLHVALCRSSLCILWPQKCGRIFSKFLKTPISNVQMFVAFSEYMNFT